MVDDRCTQHLVVSINNHIDVLMVQGVNVGKNQFFYYLGTFFLFTKKEIKSFCISFVYQFSNLKKVVFLHIKFFELHSGDLFDLNLLLIAIFTLAKYDRFG